MTLLPNIELVEVMPTDEEYGALVRAARSYAGLSQNKLAEIIGMDRKALIAIENGHRDMTVPEAREIAKACGVPFAFLLDGFRGYERDRTRLPVEEVLGALRYTLETIEERLPRTERDTGQADRKSRPDMDRLAPPTPNGPPETSGPDQPGPEGLPRP